MMTASERAEMARLQARVVELEAENRLRPFIKALLGALGTRLANIPYANWPPDAKGAFEYAAERMPTLAVAYKRLLPR